MANRTEPRPRANPRLQAKAPWRSIAVDATPLTPPHFEHSFSDVLALRRTMRTLTMHAKSQVLGLVDHLCHVHTLRNAPEGQRLRKSNISAGALHPIDVIVLDGGDQEALLYNDIGRNFEVLAIADCAEFDRSIKRMRSIAPEAFGHLLLLAGHPARASSAYHDAAPLLWRDAGAIEQLLALGAFAAGAVYLPLGLLPSAAIRSIRGDGEEVIGVGCGVIGLPC